MSQLALRQCIFAAYTRSVAPHRESDTMDQYDIIIHIYVSLDGALVVYMTAVHEVSGSIPRLGQKVVAFFFLGIS